MQEKYGFIYIWFDRKRKMYYIGSHWGTENDGYICSSNRMRKAYRRRPQDFKRRILVSNILDRKIGFELEENWLKKAEKKKSRYYNLNFRTNIKNWPFLVDDQLKKKISNSLKGHIVTKETREKISQSQKGRKFSAETIQKMKNKKLSEETKLKISNSKKCISVGKGKKLSDSHKLNISITTKGKKLSEETKLKISNSKKGVATSIKKGNLLTDSHKLNIKNAIILWHKRKNLMIV
jgi:hypothetical protein